MTLPRKFAEDTKVPIAQTRAELDALLRAWGADGVQWQDEWSAGKTTLRFVWRAPGSTPIHPSYRMQDWGMA